MPYVWGCLSPPSHDETLPLVYPSAAWPHLLRGPILIGGLGHTVGGVETITSASAVLSHSPVDHYLAEESRNRKHSSVPALLSKKIAVVTVVHFQAANAEEREK